MILGYYHLQIVFVTEVVATCSAKIVYLNIVFLKFPSGIEVVGAIRTTVMVIL